MSYIDISKLDRLFDECKESIIIMHESGQIQKMNQEAAQLLDRNHVVGQLMLDEMSSETWNAFMKQVKYSGIAFCNVNIIVENNAISTSVFGCYFRKEQSLIIWLNPNYNEDKLVNKDVLYSIIDCACYDAILSDKHGYIVNATQGVLKILGHTSEQTMQKTYEQLLHDLGISQVRTLKYFENIDCCSTSTLVFQREMASGTMIYEMTATPISSNNLIVTIFKDVTSETNVAHNENEEEKMLSNLNELVATIVHEIRNPMTSLKGFLDLLKLNMSEDGKQYFSIIDAEFERLELILEDFLYLSKPPRYSMEEISLVGVVQQIVDLMQPQAIQSNIILMLQYSLVDEFKMMGNEVRLKQLLINVIKNAIEVMPLGGTITIALGYNIDGNIELTVKDEGYGMSEETMQGLFTPFFTTKKQGSGLGLPLVKKIIEEHNGDINVWSKEGVGTEFTFTIPIDPYKYVVNIPLHESVSLT
ncbi:PAS domain-containing sensor histidine kinase [Bacillus ndiopicus]|uniref:PAS domain-containing sensor histidine kinase n=1 Tax=Bacillus ndiopicus TaxID=1347368 RepID=UPI0005A8D2BE|nr:PAS domain-containing sensor histidine kinase [Bacillus ndiopicus]